MLQLRSLKIKEGSGEEKKEECMATNEWGITL